MKKGYCRSGLASVRLEASVYTLMIVSRGFSLRDAVACCSVAESAERHGVLRPRYLRQVTGVGEGGKAGSGLYRTHTSRTIWGQQDDRVRISYLHCTHKVQHDSAVLVSALASLLCEQRCADSRRYFVEADPLLAKVTHPCLRFR